MWRRPHRLHALMLVVVAFVACGKKGPPVAPIAIVATGVSDAFVRRIGSQVYLQFTIPVRNVTGEAPADIDRMELFGFTGEPFELSGTPVDDETFLEYATLITSFEVRPPPPPIEIGDEPPAEAQPPPDVPLDARPAQGDVLTIEETLTLETQVPVDLELDDDDDEVAPVWIQKLWPDADPVQARYYVIVARNHRNQASSAAIRLQVPLDTPPPPPTSLVLQYAEETVVLSWRAPNLAPLRVQEPLVAPAEDAAVAEPLPLRSTSITPERALFTYNVYDPTAIPNAEGRVAPINPAPLEALTFVDDRLEFDLERCYVVLTVESYGPLSVESELPTPVCVRATDSFRPNAPTRLVAVGSAGVISLLWDSNDEDDLAGYIVLRGEAPGDTLQAITAEPIEDPTFRDTTITPGVRYVYAILAVDSTSNVSLESNRVEETAR